MTPTLKIYRYVTALSAPLLEWLLASRTSRGREDPLRIHERRGEARRPRPQGMLIWIHAASVGEAQSALLLIEAMKHSATGVNILVTTGTKTSATLMERRLPAFAFHQYVPLDHPQWINRFLNHWNPDLALWMESELWPNMLMALKDRKTPAALVNARLSDKSFKRWMMIKNTAQKILESFDLILTQSEQYTERFHQLGAVQAVTTDNIKYGAAPLPYDETSLATLQIATENRPIWVYASTHAGEEALACRIHKRLKETLPEILTIIVPRHPERRENIAKICFENGVSYRMRSHNAALPAPDDDIYIADTLGELGLFYRLSPIAMIGRSFSDDGGGGHNPVEAAQLGAAVLTGPNNQFQAQLYTDMRSHGAVIEAESEEELYTALLNLVTNADLLIEARASSAKFIQTKSGAADSVLQNIAPLIQKLEARHAA